MSFAKVVVGLGIVVSICCGEDLSRSLPSPTAAITSSSVPYYWEKISVGKTADILTLFCRSCAGNDSKSTVSESLPLIAVLRDTMGDATTDNDRLVYVWLLTYSKPNVGQRMLGAVPFFYWRVGEGSAATSGQVSPLMNLNTPEHAVATAIGRNIVQWAALDPTVTAVRASSRAYQTNDLDHERVHLEEAINYLRSAPVDPKTALSETEINTLMARLELRKRMLGGLVNNAHAAKFGQQDKFEQERIRSRNWEMLRQCAERTGLSFEPLNLGGTSGQYAVLWYPLDGTAPQAGSPTSSIWKLLNIKNPWTDERLKSWEGPTLDRPVDGGNARMAPLGVYNLNYPKLPLLMIDFRDSLRVRRHEMTQRTINEITAGVIGISHFTNWYYYVAADIYTFVAGRRGAAMDKSSRLDCYAQFRAALSLDRQIEPGLRREMQARAGSWALNPLESSPQRELEAAFSRYDSLAGQARDGSLEARLNLDRRAELAADQQGSTARARDFVFHEMSFGLYTHRSKESDETDTILNRYRRIQFNLAVLDSLVKAKTAPEVAYSSARVQAAVKDLGTLVKSITSPDLRKHAAATLASLKSLSHDDDLRAGCSRELAELNSADSGRPHFGIVASAEIAK